MNYGTTGALDAMIPGREMQDLRYDPNHCTVDRKHAARRMVAKEVLVDFDYLAYLGLYSDCTNYNKFTQIYGLHGRSIAIVRPALANEILCTKCMTFENIVRHGIPEMK